MFLFSNKIPKTSYIAVALFRLNWVWASICFTGWNWFLSLNLKGNQRIKQSSTTITILIKYYTMLLLLKEIPWKLSINYYGLLFFYCQLSNFLVVLILLLMIFRYYLRGAVTVFWILISQWTDLWSSTVVITLGGHLLTATSPEQYFVRWEIFHLERCRLV